MPIGRIYIEINDKYANISCSMAVKKNGEVSELTQKYQFPHIEKEEGGIPLYMLLDPDQEKQLVNNQGYPDNIVIGAIAKRVYSFSVSRLFRNFSFSNNRRPGNFYHNSTISYDKLIVCFLLSLLKEAKKVPRMADCERIYYSETSDDSYPYQQLLICMDTVGQLDEQIKNDLSNLIIKLSGISDVIIEEKE